MALTDISIRNAKPRAKPYKMGDERGLFLLVQPSGGKLWKLKYRIDGREKKLSLYRCWVALLQSAHISRHAGAPCNVARPVAGTDEGLEPEPRAFGRHDDIYKLRECADI